MYLNSFTSTSDLRPGLSALIWLGTGALVALLVLESIFRMLPVSMGLYRTEQFELWPLQGYQPRQPYTYSKSWQMLNVRRGVTNNYGHIAPFDYREQSHPVIVMGDSFVESLMNTYEETLQGQLGRRLGSRESVYGLGFSGLSASDYLALSRLARQKFAPGAAVIVLIDGDLSESLLARLGNHYFVPQGDSFRLEYRPMHGETLMKAIRRVIGEVSLYRYVFDNLGFSVGTIFKSGKIPEQQQASRPAGDALLQRRMVDYFLAELPNALSIAPQCIAFLLDADRYAIYDPKLASTPKESPDLRHYFIRQAQKLGFAVSDLDPVFRSHYARDHSKFDYWPTDRHWNLRGHGIAAGEAYSLLFGATDKGCQPGAR